MFNVNSCKFLFFFYATRCSEEVGHVYIPCKFKEIFSSLLLSNQLDASKLYPLYGNRLSKSPDRF